VGLHVSTAISERPPVFTHPEFNYENRIVHADLQTPFGGVTVASVYVPNGGKDFQAKMRFLEAMDEYADSFRATQRPLVVCGDMNIARTDADVHPKERKPRAIGQLPEERALLERILTRGLVDLGRAMDPENDRLFTWWAPWRNLRQRNIGWRLDHVFASTSLAAHASSCIVQTEVGTSDHAPVVASFAADVIRTPAAIATGAHQPGDSGC
jgi:exodeoxyribonuclease-3